MKKLSILLLTIAALAVPALAQQDTVVEEIVARVNNSIITRADIRRARDQMTQEARQQNAQNADQLIADKEKDIIRDLIDQQLLIQKGQDLGITADTELIKRLDELRKQMKVESMEDLEKLAADQGVSFEDFKQNMRNSIITQQVIGSEVSRHVQITPPEIQAFYEQHKAELDQPERVRLSELLVSVEPATPAGEKGEEQKQPPAEPDPAAVAAAEAKANELLKQLRGGAFFEEVAKKSSNGPTAENGGDLGYFKRGTLAKELEDKMFAMKVGELSDVIRTKQGFVILKVTDHTQAGVPPLEQVSNQIQDAIFMRKLQPALREYLTKLREEAYIDIKPGFVDSGASPNQTKPILASADTPKSEGEKKKRKRFLLF